MAGLNLKGGEPEAAGGAETNAAADADTNSYEQARRDRIASNRQLLVELGLASALEGLQVLKVEKQKDQKKTAGGADKKRKAPENNLPTRHSKRLSGEGKTEDAEEEDVQDLDEIERPQPRPRVQGGRSWEERMAEIKMGSLVDLSKQQAVFIVVGSTNNHYKVHLSDNASKCGCRDFRIRGKQRPCKHLRLLTESLGVESNPKGWYGAVTEHLDKQGNDSGE